MNVQIEDVLKKSASILEVIEIPERHSFYQIEKFIIGKEATGQGQIWQVVRELEARTETFDDLKKQLEEFDDENELLELEIKQKELLKKELDRDNNPENKEINDVCGKKIDIEIRKLSRKKNGMKESLIKVSKKIKSLLEEINFLCDGYESLTKNHGPIKDFDNQEMQEELWNEKLLQEFNLRIIMGQPLSIDLVKSILCLHDHSSVKKHVVANFEQLQKQLIENNNSIVEEKVINKTAKIKGKDE